MIEMSALKITLISGFGIIGGYIAQHLGGWDIPLQVLLIFMGLDVFAGLLLARYGRSNKSDSGFISSKSLTDGLLKKGFVLIIVIAGYYIDLLIGTDLVRYAVILAFIGSEGLSLLEHAIIAGVPVPEVVVSALELIKQKSDETVAEGLKRAGMKREETKEEEKKEEVPIEEEKLTHESSGDGKET